ncbi:MAG: wax ester/triacylglycerol synthase family O-acyltransferase [Deltaproteobacteria bacterium]|nr:wax ester/triacylglycerol synthase family O-acyltransferase [Deltaproteobacteria bacterium]
MPEHMDRLTATDASFVVQEKGPSHMHIGGVMVFEGPPPPYAELLSHIEARLHLVPRYRQRVLVPRFEMGRPLWIDDTRFNLTYHVRHSALPPPGSEELLQRLTARLFSQRLDRTKPLWEIYLVEGLEGGRFALISKTHHAMVDGISGVDIATLLFDLTRDAPPSPPAPKWTPHPEPSQIAVAADLVTDVTKAIADMTTSTADALREPRRAWEIVSEAAEGLGEVLWAGLTPAAASPLNGPIGPHRRVLWVRTRLSDYKLIKNRIGGTVNDVVLATVAGALGSWMRRRAARTEGLELRAGVPVSVRAEIEHNQLGNRVTMMAAPLPVYCNDAVERLQIVRAAMKDLKESKQALGAQLIVGLERFAPPTLFAQASRLHFSPMLVNLIVTNVPGPQFPLFLMGREMLEMAPVGFIVDGFRLIVALVSYNGYLTFGLMGDYDSMTDLDVIAAAIEAQLAELVEAAESSSGDAGA